MPWRGKIGRVVFVTNGHDAVLRRWAVEYLCEAIKSMGVPAKTVDISSEGDRLCDGADLVVVYRSFDLKTIRLIKRMRQRGTFVAFFLDDYLFQKDCKYTFGHQYGTEAMQEADVLVSSSEELLRRMPDKPKILRRSVLDEDAMSTLQQQYRRGVEFSVGWTAGAGRGSGMDEFVREFLRELENGMRDKERCSFKCFGMRGFESTDRVSVEKTPFFGWTDWMGLYRKMKSFDLGVVINPLEESEEFHWCKSELKFVESAAMGVPLVTSRVPPYKGLIKEGVNGFFASTPKEFAEKVLLLMRDERMSRRVSGEAYRQVCSEYNVRMNALKFLKDVEEAMREVKGK